MSFVRLEALARKDCEMNHWIRFGVAFVLMITPLRAEVAVPATAPPMATAFPGCGPASTYCLMVAIGKSESLSQVQRKFTEAAPNDDPRRTSISTIRGVLSGFGVRTKCIRIPPCDIAKLQTPCILYVHPGKWPGLENEAIGHFVCMVACDQTQVHVFDWSGLTNQPARVIQRDEFVRVWNGEGLVLDNRISGMWAGLAILFVILFAGVAFNVIAIYPRASAH